MNTAVINIKVEPAVKKQAHKVADDLGFSLSSLVNAFLKNLIKTKTIAFSALEKEELSDYARKAINESLKNYKNGKFVSFDDPEKAIAFFDKMIANDKKD